MYIQSSFLENIQCNKCDKDIVLDILSNDEYGIKYEDDLVFTVPKNCYIQTGGDYCGGRWIYFFCSAKCAKREVEI